MRFAVQIFAVVALLSTGFAAPVGMFQFSSTIFASINVLTAVPADPASVQVRNPEPEPAVPCYCYGGVCNTGCYGKKE